VSGESTCGIGRSFFGELSGKEARRQTKEKAEPGRRAGLLIAGLSRMKAHALRSATSRSGVIDLVEGARSPAAPA